MAEVSDKPTGAATSTVEGNDNDGVGHHATPVPFQLETRRTAWYVFARLTLALIIECWFRPVVYGRARVPRNGPAILAPIHRSFADFAFMSKLSHRKIFFMTKDELWKKPRFGKLVLSLGGFPVRREAADREALRRAQQVLEHGQLLVLFPEGTRGEGTAVGRIHEGAAFLAARTGAPIIPVGIGGSDVSMPKGQRIPKRLRIRVVVGEPIAAPPRTEGGRVPRSSIHVTTEALREGIQTAYDEARRDFERG